MSAGVSRVCPQALEAREGIVVEWLFLDSRPRMWRWTRVKEEALVFGSLREARIMCHMLRSQDREDAFFGAYPALLDVDPDAVLAARQRMSLEPLGRHMRRRAVSPAESFARLEGRGLA